VDKASLPEGWDKAVEEGILDFQKNIQPNSLSALSIVIHPECRGQVLSERLGNDMKSLAIKSRFNNMVDRVRIYLISMYPLIPIEEYIELKSIAGTPFHPWIRIHIKAGASIIKVAEKSMVIPASIKEWEEWTGMKLLSSGSYVINEGLVPLEVDMSANKGV